MKIGIWAFAFAAVVILQGAPSAQTFPAKPVKVILPYPTATGPDTVIRLVGDKVSRWWGQQLVVENRPGGNAFIAMDAAKRSAADGYSLLLADAQIMTLVPHLFKKVPYDPFNDFDPVAPMWSVHFFLTVPVDSPWKNVADLIAAAKAKNGALTYGSSGVGSAMHLGGAMLEGATGAPMTHVPYKDTQQVFVDISRGEVGWAFGTASTTSPMYQAKKVKYLAIAAPQRHPAFRDVPTIVEAGGPPVELRTWVGLFAPRGTPQPIVERLNADVAKALREADIQERLNSVGFQPWPAPAQDLAKVMTADFQQSGEAVKRLKISLD